MSLDLGHDRVSLETPRQSVDNVQGIEGTYEARPEGLSPAAQSDLRERVDVVLQSDVSPTDSAYFYER